MTDNNSDTSSGRSTTPQPGSHEAANLVREKIDALHDDHQGDLHKKSKHQASLIERFWAHHHSHPDKESAWQQFYHGLNDSEKHQIWEEAQGQQPQSHGKKHDEPKPTEEPKTQSKTDLKSQLIKNSKKATSFAKGSKSHFKPILTAIIVIAVIMLLNYNDLVVAQVRQYVTPGSGQNSPIIIDPNSDVAVGKEPRIIIPKINVDVPVVYNEKSYDEAAIQAALERGVVHYGDTPVPGEPGNNVIVGHSSNNFFNSGKYKFAFVLLDRLEKGDTFILHYKGQRYIYKVFNKVVVEPDDFSIIQPTKTPTTTLITCTPPGTSWRRLAIQAEQISPAPDKKQTNQNQKTINPEEASIVPGNSQSLFQNLFDNIF